MTDDPGLAAALAVVLETLVPANLASIPGVTDYAMGVADVATARRYAKVLEPAALAWVDAWVDARLTDPATVEAVAERISWDGGDMQRWREDAHPDHNRWTWRGDGHGDVMREEYRHLATAALAVVRGLLGGTGGEG